MKNGMIDSNERSHSGGEELDSSLGFACSPGVSDSSTPCNPHKD